MHRMSTPPSPRSLEPDDDPRPTLLIADDVAAIRQLLLHELGEEFRIVGEASDGAQAAARAADLRPDVVLLDLNMPGHDGVTAIGSIREACPDTTIVVLTGLESSRVRDEVLSLGAHAFLEKSAPMPELRRQLTEMLGRRPGEGSPQA